MKAVVDSDYRQTIGLARQRLIDRGAFYGGDQGSRKIGLCIKVYKQDTMPLHRQDAAKIGDSGRFADTALVVGDGYDFCFHLFSLLFVRGLFVLLFHLHKMTSVPVGNLLRRDLYKCRLVKKIAYRNLTFPGIGKLEKRNATRPEQW